MKLRLSTIIPLLTLLLLSGCFFFLHPNKKDLRNQKIPPELLDSWRLITLNEKTSSCPITLTFQPKGKLRTDFIKQYEGWFWIQPNGLIVIHCGFFAKPFYEGYESCSLSTSTVADHLNVPDFKFEIRNDTLLLRDRTFTKVVFKKN